MQFPSHVEWIADRLGAGLLGETRRQGASGSLRAVLGVLCDADPSAGKRSVQWLAERLIDGGLLWEDIRSGVGSKAHATLVAFEAHRRSLDGTCRHLDAHPTLAAAWNAVAHLLPAENEDVDSPRGRELRRRERASARADSLILHERPGLVVAVPLTEQASKWWGRGTRWCTAADKDNAFAEYDAVAPLVVIVLADEKLQLFMGRQARDVQFLDSADRAVSTEWVAGHWTELGPIVTWAAARFPGMLKFVPETKRDAAMWRAAVALDGKLLTWVSPGLRDRALCLAAVGQNGLALECVPGDLVDREMSMLAIRNDGNALGSVPRSLRDRAMCLEAVRQCGLALRSVPEHFRDRETCLVAVTRHGTALRDVPVHLRNPEMCIRAVSDDIQAMSSVPEVMRDREVRLAAATSSVAGLSVFEMSSRDRELCMAAVRANGYNLHHVPEHLVDRTMCLTAVKSRGLSLKMVPDTLRDREMCLAAVSIEGSVICCVPRSLRDLELCVVAATQNRAALQSMPQPMRDEVLLVIGPPCGDTVNRWSEGVALGGLREALAAGSQERDEATGSHSAASHAGWMPTTASHPDAA